MDLQIKVIDSHLLKHREHGHYHLLGDNQWTECACVAERVDSDVYDLRPQFAQVETIVFQTPNGSVWCVTPTRVPFQLNQPLAILLGIPCGEQITFPLSINHD